MTPKSIRTFIGARDYTLSRSFYQTLGFTEMVLSEKLVYFQVSDALGFYLQRYYVQEWVDNSMLFFEVEDVDAWFTSLKAMQLEDRFEGVRLLPIREEDWGRVFFLHDPSGVLWQVGTFK